MRIIKSMSYLFVLATCSLLLSSCLSQNQSKEMEKHPKSKDHSTQGNKAIISAPLVQKAFIAKNGKALDQQEWYIRRSVQDYFIKFCESKISKEDLEEYIAKKGKELAVITLEVEFREGEWDICEDDPDYAQSRIGAYAVVYRIIK